MLGHLSLPGVSEWRARERLEQHLHQLQKVSFRDGINSNSNDDDDIKQANLSFVRIVSLQKMLLWLFVN